MLKYITIILVVLSLSGCYKKFEELSVVNQAKAHQLCEDKGGLYRFQYNYSTGDAHKYTCNNGLDTTISKKEFREMILREENWVTKDE